MWIFWWISGYFWYSLNSVFTFLRIKGWIKGFEGTFRTCRIFRTTIITYFISSENWMSRRARRENGEDDSLSSIAREAEARLAAKRAARAEAREIRLKELEKQQREVNCHNYHNREFTIIAIYKNRDNGGIAGKPEVLFLLFRQWYLCVERSFLVTIILSRNISRFLF